MSIPPLPFLSNYVTLSGYLGDVLAQDKVETKGAITSGLSLLAKGWAEYLGKRELRDNQMIVSSFIYGRVCLR